MRSNKKQLPSKHIQILGGRSEWGRERFRRQISENHGEQCMIAGLDGSVVNPYARKIAAILEKESGRVPIYYTVPRKSGKREFRRVFSSEYQLPAISFTGKSDPW